jgi:hypothetical protein
VLRPPIQQLILSTKIPSNSRCRQSFGTICGILQLVKLFDLGNCPPGAKNMKLE